MVSIFKEKTFINAIYKQSIASFNNHLHKGNNPRSLMEVRISNWLMELCFSYLTLLIMMCQSTISWNIDINRLTDIFS